MHVADRVSRRKDLLSMAQACGLQDRCGRWLPVENKCDQSCELLKRVTLPGHESRMR